MHSRDIKDSLGISLLLLTSFYFFNFNSFAIPDVIFILTEISKIFIYLFFIILIFFKITKYKFKKFFLFFFLLYVSIYLLKLIFTISGNISLHFFLKLIYSYIFQFDLDGSIPLYIKILSYLTPYFFCSFFLFFFNNRLIQFKNFYVRLGFIISLIFFFDLFKIYQNQNISTDLSNNVISLSDINKKKKVLWLLFDGLDPEYLNNKNNNKKKLFKTLNELKDTGVFHTNIYPPANKTLLSMPANLVGTNIKDVFPKDRKLLLKNLDDKIIPFTFENTIFNEITNLGLSVSALSTVIEYCSAYLISHKWKLCEDLNSKKENNSILKVSFNFFFSFFYKIKIIFNELGLVDIDNHENKNNKNNKNIIKNGNVTLASLEYLTDPFIKSFDDLNLDKIYSRSFNRYNSADHEQLITIDKINDLVQQSNFTYVHIYNPHIFPGSVNHILQKLGLSQIKSYEDNYIIKYLYIDIFIKNLLYEIKKNNFDDFMLIISSDHWRRSKFDSDSTIFRGDKFKTDWQAISASGDFHTKPMWHKTLSSSGQYIGNAYFSAKILNDNSNYLLTKPSNTIVIPSLIKNFFLEKINFNKDIYNFIESSKIKINVLIN